jgi:hypothetical protein
LKLYGTNQHLINADKVSDKSAQTIKKDTVGSVVASKEIGLEANYDKNKYTVMSRDQNAGRSHNIKIYNSSFERVEEFQTFAQP